LHLLQGTLVIAIMLPLSQQCTWSILHSQSASEPGKIF
jgi:hypothetical protein